LECYTRRIRMLRKLFGREREKVTGEWRKPHDEELRNLYASPYTIWMTQS